MARVRSSSSRAAPYCPQARSSSASISSSPIRRALSDMHVVAESSGEVQRATMSAVVAPSRAASIRKPAAMAPFASCSSRTSACVSDTAPARASSRAPLASRPLGSTSPRSSAAATAATSPLPQMPRGAVSADHPALERAVAHRYVADRAFRRPHPHPDLPRLECRTGRRRCAHHPLPVADHDFAVRPQIDQGRESRRFVQSRRHDPRQDVAADESPRFGRKVPPSVACVPTSAGSNGTCDSDSTGAPQYRCCIAVLPPAARTSRTGPNFARHAADRIPHRARQRRAGSPMSCSMRVIRSAPQAACGLSAVSTASTSPVIASTSCAAIVVVPRSTASTRPGAAARTGTPSCPPGPASPTARSRAPRALRCGTGRRGATRRRVPPRAAPGACRR